MICLRAEGGYHAAELEQGLRAWQEQAAKLRAGEITAEDYNRWRYCYPAYDDTRVSTVVPPDIPVHAKRGGKSKAR